MVLVSMKIEGQLKSFVTQKTFIYDEYEKKKRLTQELSKSVINEELLVKETLIWASRTKA